jgi:N-acetylmuramoyl-L-alanine amidase
MTPRMITIHCSATPNGKNFTGDDIRKWHTDAPPKGRGWSEIGYHGVIEINGDFFRGRPDDRLGAHVEGHNDGNLGVCLVGMDKFFPNQFMSLRWILNHWCELYGIKPDKIFGHYEWDTARAQKKTCPNLEMGTVRRWFMLGDNSLIQRYLVGSPPLV